MSADIPLEPKPDRWERFLLKPCHLETAVKDRCDLTLLEASPRRKVEKRQYIRSDQHAGSETE